MRKIKYSHILTPIFFIAAIAIIDYAFPREGKFRYKFNEGKPWGYELLTAPTDFPVYKTDEEIKHERDSVAEAFQPYFRFDPSVVEQVIDKLQFNIQDGQHSSHSTLYQRYIEESLKRIYANGIITNAAKEQLQTDNRTHIKTLTGNIAQTKSIQDLYTVRTAYQTIIAEIPTYLNPDILRTYAIDTYLSENLSYDKIMSEKALDDQMRTVAVASGMVQAGEKIVDRGEIIDGHTYDVLRSLKIVNEAKTGINRHQHLALIGQTAIIAGLILCFYFYMRTFRPRHLYSRKNTIFLLLCIIAPGLLTATCAAQHPFNIYILPYAIVPIVVRTFIDSRTALFTHITSILICSFMAPNPHEFLILQTIAGMLVTFTLREMSERSQLMRCALYICLAYSVAYTAMLLYAEGDFTKLNPFMYLYFAVNFILLMFAYVLVYMLEKTFGYISSITLVELSNINNPLLKRLSEVAPGTFQHSIQVSLLATAAIEKIGGNSTLVRTGAIYHDIGKGHNPAFFTENQTSVNPHLNLSPEQSAQIVINHVHDGVRIAQKANIPQAIIDFIRTHHGKGKTKYFYIDYKNRHPDEEVDESLFTYPGPNPFTKETAVLMMADSVEAASRSLKNHTEEDIAALVNRIIDTQLSDGLFNNAPITLMDIEKAKRVFIDKLKIAYHTRISYPEEK